MQANYDHHGDQDHQGFRQPAPRGCLQGVETPDGQKTKEKIWTKDLETNDQMTKDLKTNDLMTKDLMDKRQTRQKI